MRVRGYELTYPRVVFVAVLLVTLTTVAVAAGTSSAAYGSYNYDWDGTSEIRAVAADAGSDVEIVRDSASSRGSTGGRSGTNSGSTGVPRCRSERPSARPPRRGTSRG